MSLIRNLVKSVSLFLALSASSVFAATIIPSTTIDDSHDNGVGGPKYDIDRMVVELSDGVMQVDVYTNFGNYNNQSRYGWRDKKIVLGDLLIGSGGQEGQYDYAFKLNSSARYGNYSNNGLHSFNNGGNLYEIGSTKSASSYHGFRNSNPTNGAIFGRSLGANLGSGSFSVNNVTYPSFDKISFAFNVGDIFKDSSQIALSWAMSCYNDAVHGLVDVSASTGGGGGGTSVPEPQTLLLMLLGVVGIAARRKQQGFKA